MSAASELECEIRDWADEVYRNRMIRVLDVAVHTEHLTEAFLDDRMGRMYAVPGVETPALPGMRRCAVIAGIRVHDDPALRRDRVYAFIDGKWRARLVRAWAHLEDADR